MKLVLYIVLIILEIPSFVKSKIAIFRFLIISEIMGFNIKKSKNRFFDFEFIFLLINKKYYRRASFINFGLNVTEIIN